MLVQIGDHDSVAPPAAARRTAALAGTFAESRSYPVDHFDVYDGEWQRQALADQIQFLDRQLEAARLGHASRRSSLTQRSPLQCTDRSVAVAGSARATRSESGEVRGG